MELLECMLSRRSVRSYTEEAIPAEALRSIELAGLLAPSSRNLRPVELITVTDPETLRRLAEAKTMGAAPLKGAKAAIVVLGDRERSDVWVEDCSIVMTHLHLQAVNLGVGSCWIQLRRRTNADGSAEDYVRNLLGIPERYGVPALLALGMPEKLPAPHTEEDADFSKVHQERFA